MAVPAVLECEHSENQDPRRAGECLKCGRTMPRFMLRSLKRERELLHRINDKATVVDLVHTWVIRRAGVGPWRDLPTRDFSLEAIEEAVDGIAYMLGKADQRMHQGFEDELSAQDMMALHHFTEALRCLVTKSDD